MSILKIELFFVKKVKHFLLKVNCDYVSVRSKLGRSLYLDNTHVVFNLTRHICMSNQGLRSVNYFYKILRHEGLKRLYKAHSCALLVQGIIVIVRIYNSLISVLQIKGVVLAMYWQLPKKQKSFKARWTMVILMM